MTDDFWEWLPKAYGDVGDEPVFTKYNMEVAFAAGAEAEAKRMWVGLTDEEITQGNKESWVTEQAWQSAVWWAEAKLKEKNGTTPPAPYDQTELELCDECGWKTLIPESGCLNCERSKTKKPLTDEQCCHVCGKPLKTVAHGITKEN
jgi:hypothetical protein